MSRSGYSSDWDGDDNPPEFYRQAVENAINGKRGQAFLRELVEALDAMPEKRLLSHKFVVGNGAGCCALGSVALKRQLPSSKLEDLNKRAIAAADDEYGGVGLARQMAKLFGIARSMAAEVMYENDEGSDLHLPRVLGNPDPYERWKKQAEARWRHMRDWAWDNLRPENREGLDG